MHLERCPKRPPMVHFTRQASGSYPDRGSVDHDSRQNALPTYLPPGRAAKRKKTKIGGTFYLPVVGRALCALGRSKPGAVKTGPTYLFAIASRVLNVVNRPPGSGSQRAAA